jgi:NAD(P)-dependent dehydrogenase (short-subunit alcohol dehydrogenase family)
MTTASGNPTRPLVAPRGGAPVAPAGTRRDPELRGQTVVLLGAGSDVALQTSRLASAAGAEVVAPAVSADRPEALDRFFAALPRPVDHVLVAGADPYRAPVADFDFDRAQRDVDEHLWLPVRVAHAAVGRVRPGGALIFTGGTGGRRRGVGLSLVGALTAARPELIANLAVELAPIRVNLIGAGVVDRPLSARLLGAALTRYSDDPVTTHPIARVVRPADVAALAVHLMCDRTVTGATYDVDGGHLTR